DYATVPDDLQPAGQQFTEPVPVRKKEPVQPVVAAAAPAEEEATEVATDAATATTVEDTAGTVVGTASGTAAGTATRRTPVARLSGEQKPSVAAAQKSVLPPEPPPPPQVAATPALPSPARRQFVAAGAAAEPVQAAPPAAPQLSSGYVLHSAIFHDPGRAEEWQAKLAQEGIPSTLEARLQIGPFKNRAEAEAARRKMNKLGIETLRGLGKTGNP
ncbi:SPOR domain-containing protein, partial [Accumulibacter sp.]|uniref:SPOR domain-containing protein n=1 Tax=Accumulibacter sp. TaxID=2053492 RepID=UPI0028C4BDA6